MPVKPHMQMGMAPTAMLPAQTGMQRLKVAPLLEGVRGSSMLRMVIVMGMMPAMAASRS